MEGFNLLNYFDFEKIINYNSMKYFHLVFIVIFVQSKTILSTTCNICPNCRQQHNFHSQQSQERNYKIYPQQTIILSNNPTYIHRDTHKCSPCSMNCNNGNRKYKQYCSQCECNNDQFYRTKNIYHVTQIGYASQNGPTKSISNLNLNKPIVKESNTNFNTQKKSTNLKYSDEEQHINTDNIVVDKIIGQNNLVIGKPNQVIGNNNSMQGAHNNVIGQSNHICGNKNQVIGSRNVIGGLTNTNS